MRASARRSLPAVLLGLALAAGCTIDFDRFDFGNNPTDAAGGTAATGGTGAAPTGGLGGAGGGGTGGQAGSGGTGGIAGDASADVDADVSDAPPDVVGDRACPTGEKSCNGTCVSESDPAFGCGPSSCAACNLTHATATCSSGGCQILSCDSGFENCDSDPSNGCEVSPSTDVNHCGGCNDACVVPNATPGCVNGTCTVQSCNQDFDDCDTNPANGCETHLFTDSLHCGACTTACQQIAGIICENGQCVSTPCQGNFGDCDNNPGCETNLQTSTAHCGACNDPCVLANATPGCTAGQCVIAACNTGFDDCDGIAGTGCEEDLRDNANHCGACNRACSGANVVTPTCSNGVCTSSCAAGFGNCSLPASGADDGCETNLQTSVQNCGACGVGCSNAHGSTSCQAGICVPVCSAGFADCNGNLQDGCETDTDTDPSHCNGCGNLCTNPNGSTTCVNGLCVPSCTQGFADCDGNSQDGCETNVLTNVDHCGTCGGACSSVNVTSRSCSGGLCQPTCGAPFSDCNGPQPGSSDDGCEANTVSDPLHCGACGRACSTQNVLSRACSAGTCVSTCVLGFANCTQPAAPNADDGCERSVSANNTSCGGCNLSCASQTTVGLVCGGPTPNQCGCAGDSLRCRGSGTGGTCESSGRCRCGTNLCAAGEGCLRIGGDPSDRCSCNGGGACLSGQTCCPTPLGCKDVATDAANCGACGHACPPNFACQSGTCVCTASGQCSGGGSGVCTAGRCVCGGTTCSAGQRCLAGNVCG